MLTQWGQVKHSATWGGAKSSTSAPPEKQGNAQGSRKRSNAKRAAQFVLCFGLILMFCINASAKKLSKQLSPELYQMVQTGNPNQMVDVIVQYKNFAKDRSKNNLTALKHRAVPKRHFGVVNAIYMSIPLGQVSDLADEHDVRYVSLDRKVKMTLDDVTYAVMADMALNYGYSGEGVGIAIVDSGVSPHLDLNKWGTLQSRVVYSESFVPGDPSTEDGYGHGTHVAGIAAGNGYGAQVGFKYEYQGTAPKANIVNLRVLDNHGAGTDSAVIAAIQRAIELKNQYNIRVLNLSLGRAVYESFVDDPLDQAVEAAWKAGIVVVVAAGNRGRDNSMGTDGYGTIGVPGNDPFVITVGAMDMKNTLTPADDQIATYSSKGPSLVDHVVKPDLVAPGDKVVSLRSVNSTLDLADPLATVSCLLNCGLNPGNYMKLSGTSMATPVVAGAAALMIQKDPTLTPDIVKARLMKTAIKNLPMRSAGADTRGRKFRNQYDIFTYGSGYLNVLGALNNTDRSKGIALSPRVYVDATGSVKFDSGAWAETLLADSVMWGDSSLWGDSVMWGDASIWGSSVMWGDTALQADSVLWGDSVMWGDSATVGFSVIWGDSVLWGDSSMEAFSEVDGGDCAIDDLGNVICDEQ